MKFTRPNLNRHTFWSPLHCSLCCHLLKSWSVWSSSSPWPSLSRWRLSISSAMIFSNSWLRAYTKRWGFDQPWAKPNYLIGVCDEESTLVRVVVVDVGDDLNSNISLACTRWSYYHCEPWLHACSDSLHLSRNKWDSISASEWANFSGEKIV